MTGNSKRLWAAGVILSLGGSCVKVGPPPDITVEATPERLARGKYLVENVALCTDCHSQRNWDYYTGPVKPETKGMGGMHFDEEMGFPGGTIYMSNITPAALGDWTDGEIFRTIASGVNKDGKALFPIMPYLNYAHLPQEDLYSIIAYIKTFKPIENEVPERKLKFPLNLLVRTMPKEYIPLEAPDVSNEVAYGKHLLTIASCSDCHTPTNEKGEPIEGMYLAGGAEHKEDWGSSYSANITPDSVTGIGNKSRENFIGLFKAFDSEEGRTIEVPEGEEGSNVLMPWTAYAGMVEQDLGAIYTYLRTVKPVKNQVKKGEITPEKLVEEKLVSGEDSTEAEGEEVAAGSAVQ